MWVLIEPLIFCKISSQIYVGSDSPFHGYSICHFCSTPKTVIFQWHLWIFSSLSSPVSYNPNTAWKVSVNLCIQSGYRKIRTRKNSVFRHFSRSENNRYRFSTSAVRSSFLVISSKYHLSSLTASQPVCSQVRWNEKTSIHFFSYNFTMPKTKL